MQLEPIKIEILHQPVIDQSSIYTITQECRPSIIEEEIYVHTGITNKFRFVKIIKNKGDLWTSDGYKASSVNLIEASYFIGRKVRRDGIEGIILHFCSTSNKMTEGKYIKGFGYLMPNRISFYNQEVYVNWFGKDLYSGWQNINDLEFL